MKKWLKTGLSLLIAIGFGLSCVSVTLINAESNDGSIEVVEQIESSEVTDEVFTEEETVEETEEMTEETQIEVLAEETDGENASEEEGDTPDGYVPPNTSASWTISKSKTATNLDENFETQVTLSLPSYEEELESDIVFVLDKSTSPDLEQQALDMLAALQTQVVNTDAKVNVGVIIFNREAHRYGWYDLETQYAEIEAAVKTEISSGTNTHAGLLEAQTMLSEHSYIPNSRKYMVFVSDGITYMYNSTPTAVGQQNGDHTNVFAGPDNWETKYGDNTAPADWNAWLGSVSGQMTADGSTYEDVYGGSYNSYISYEDKDNHANSVDRALYNTYSAWTQLNSSYNCFAMVANTDSGGEYTWGPSFMSYLAGGKTVSFDAIQKEIYYLLDVGSTVTDYMGYTEDYNFDFIADAARLSLRVGEESYDAYVIAENQWGFKPLGNNTYAYTLTYMPGNLEDTEHFVWMINEPVSNFAPVSLTYALKLKNPKTEAGTYGMYDADGSSGYTELYTNISATLNAIDSNGVSHTEDFNKPTVSYTVTASEKPEEETKKDPENTETAQKTQTSSSLNSGLYASVMVSAVSLFLVLGLLKIRKRA